MPFCPLNDITFSEDRVLGIGFPWIGTRTRAVRESPERRGIWGQLLRVEENGFCFKYPPPTKTTTKRVFPFLH